MKSVKISNPRPPPVMVIKELGHGAPLAKALVERGKRILDLTCRRGPREAAKGQFRTTIRAIVGMEPWRPFPGLEAIGFEAIRAPKKRAAGPLEKIG